jgi:RNA polymerase sigma-70 factor, ECF subfamily
MAGRQLRELRDTEVMVRVRKNDERAFRELYGRYQRRLLDFFYGMSRDAQTAQDLTQETFFRIWRLRDKYAATGSFPAYLFSFARNIWLEHCRDLTKRRKLGRRETFETYDFERPSQRMFYPDEAAWRAELSDKIGDALLELPENQRMAFVLRHIDGLSLPEVASVLQCPANTVRSRKLLAVKKLRDKLRDVFIGLEAS